MVTIICIIVRTEGVRRTATGTSGLRRQVGTWRGLPGSRPQPKTNGDVHLYVLSCGYFHFWGVFPIESFFCCFVVVVSPTARLVLHLPQGAKCFLNCTELNQEGAT